MKLTNKEKHSFKKSHVVINDEHYDKIEWDFVEQEKQALLYSWLRDMGVDSFDIHCTNSVDDDGIKHYKTHIYN